MGDTPTNGPAWSSRSDGTMETRSSASRHSSWMETEVTAHRGAFVPASAKDRPTEAEAESQWWPSGKRPVPGERGLPPPGVLGEEAAPEGVALASGVEPQRGVRPGAECPRHPQTGLEREEVLVRVRGWAHPPCPPARGRPSSPGPARPAPRADEAAGLGQPTHPRGLVVLRERASAGCWPECRRAGRRRREVAVGVAGVQLETGPCRRAPDRRRSRCPAASRSCPTSGRRRGRARRRSG